MTPKETQRPPINYQQNQRAGRADTEGSMQAGFWEHNALCQGLEYVANLHAIRFCWDEISAGVPLERTSVSVASLLKMATNAGFHHRLQKRKIKSIPDAALPVMLLLNDGGVAILENSSQPGEPFASEWNPAARCWDAIPARTLQSRYTGYLIFFRPKGYLESSQEAKWKQPFDSIGQTGWFWRSVWQFKGDILRAIPASILISALAIAMPIFTMSVYDRVVPNDAEETLWVLAIGVLAVFVMEFLMRLLRGAFLGRMGKSLDGVLSGTVYDHLMAIRLDSKNSSSGVLSGKARAYENLRDFFISATLATLVDIPVSLLMIFIIFHLGGAAGWVPVIAAAVMILLGLITRIPLTRTAGQSYRQGLERQAFLTETINGLEAVKSSNAQGFFRRRMERMIRDSSDVDAKAHWYSLLGNCTTSWIINTSNVALIILCVYRIKEGEMSMGAMIACIILLSRSLNPLSSVATMATRLARVKQSLKGLAEIMAIPLEYGETEHHYSQVNENVTPHYVLKDVTLKFEGKSLPALHHIHLEIKPGERWAILGRIGSGKSTLLKLLTRIVEPTSGQILINQLDYGQFHPATLRRLAAYMQQEASLFQGTLHDNLCLGKPWATDSEVMEMAEAVGIADMINSFPMGLMAPTTERGASFSGGERQSICLVRTLLQHPRMLLLDEPTSSMDINSEAKAMAAIDAYLNADPLRSMIIATHKFSVLNSVDHCAVLDAGRLILAGPRDSVLNQLKANSVNNPPSHPMMKRSAI